MNTKDKNFLIITFFVMALSGVGVHLVDEHFPIQTAYGLRTNPIIDELKLIHNLGNFLFIFAVGNIFKGHILLGLKGIKKKGKYTGWLFFSLILLLCLTGTLLLYVTNEDLVEFIEGAHWIMGLLSVVTFLVHYFLNKSKNTSKD